MRSTVPYTLLILTCSAAMASAGEALTCPKLDKNRFPALIYTDGHTLHVAHFGGGRVHQDEVVFPSDVYLDTLRDGVFLAREQNDRHATSVHIVDLHAGIVKPLTEGGKQSHNRILRISPERNKAVLLHGVRNVPELIFIELNLTTYETKTVYRIDRDSLGDEYDRIRGPLSLSPDFTHLAYATRHEPADAMGPSTYTLKILNLETKKIRELDPSVHATLSPLSSAPYGYPAFIWIDNREILYQDMPVNPTRFDSLASDSDFALKTVDIQTGTIVTRDVQKGRLTVSGGQFAHSIDYNRLVFKPQRIVNAKSEIVPSTVPRYRVEQKRGARTLTVLDGDTILYQGERSCSRRRVSPSGKHFAYLLGSDRSEGMPSEIYVKLEGRAEPLKVGKVRLYPLTMEWIENNPDL